MYVYVFDCLVINGDRIRVNILRRFFMMDIVLGFDKDFWFIVNRSIKILKEIRMFD